MYKNTAHHLSLLSSSSPPFLAAQAASSHFAALLCFSHPFSPRKRHRVKRVALPLWFSFSASQGHTNHKHTAQTIDGRNAPLVSPAAFVIRNNNYEEKQKQISPACYVKS
jgi:hypothetical protein